MSTGLPLMKNILTTYDKNVLITLGLMAAVSATDAAIQKNVIGSETTVPIIWNEKMNDIIKIVKSLEESSSLIKVLVKQLKMK